MDHQHMMATSFASADEMIAHHVTTYGAIGQIVAEAVLEHASLWPGLNPLDFRIVLSPIELGPYNKHVGYTISRRRQAHAPRYIIANRHVCCWQNDGSMVLACTHQYVIDFLVHEMTHHRQADILLRDGIRQNRGAHRDAGWYAAIAEAAPSYLGVEFPPERWPRQRDHDGRLTEVEACHWPWTFRRLIAQQDARLLPLCESAA